MNHEGWSAAVQAAVIAISTWYIRRGGRKDRSKVIQVAASQSTLEQVLNRVSRLETVLALVKHAVVKDHEARGLTSLKRELAEPKNRDLKKEEER